MFNNVKDNLRNKITQLVAVVSLVVIALGGINDSLEAGYKIYDIALSNFTDLPSNDKLDKIYIRASEGVLEETFGAPSYIKETSMGEVIKYFSDSKFIISTISKNNAIAAFLVFPTTQFKPNTASHAGGENLIGFPMSSNDQISNSNAITSNIVSYYLEESFDGEFGNLHSSISGYSDFLRKDGEDSYYDLLNEFSESQLLGIENEELLKELRSKVPVNFYGYSILPFNVLEYAILTRSEYDLINRSI
ncbi:hypothetical protein HGP28_03730 [Vibrio sp. SM6]|uniref:Uncharacterized protein n=1 Tax=Vibrio agarilyticus TaxID=2726741 RepID=A0A7X8TP28_9VIBR|nr:ETEC_3214 domain-containing protein [Vibrio agarilyticus]NLS12001.1 hypothetical protein [Vibrio agarilyticus]